MNKFAWERLAYKQPFNGEALRVLWCYSDHADAETRLTFPKIRDIASETNISVEKVGKYRNELLAAGWLTESDEKTTRGNPKLMLAVGTDIEPGYLGEKRRVNTNSGKNLIPAAKQKKACGSLDFPDKSTPVTDAPALDFPDGSGLENAEVAGLEDADTGSLDFPDVTTSKLNNQIQTININQKDTEPVVADAPTVTVEETSSLKEERGGSASSLRGTSPTLPSISSLLETGSPDSSLQYPTFLEPATPSPEPSAVPFEPYKIKAIEQQVGALAPSQSWSPSHQRDILALALDPLFMPDILETGSRIFQANMERRGMNSGW